MNLYDFTKKYGEGKGESMMWKTVKVISDHIDDNMSAEAKEYLMRDLYATMASGHYDEHYAKEDVSEMFYLDEKGERHNAPYWTDEQVKSAYETIKGEIPDYNMWDYYVTINMVRSDQENLMKKWFPNATPEELTKKWVEASVNWLKDDDLDCTTKIWRYLDAMK